MIKFPKEATLWNCIISGIGLISGVAIIAIMHQVNLLFYSETNLIIDMEENVIREFLNDPIYLSGRLISISTGCFFAGAISKSIRPILSVRYAIISGLILMIVGITDLSMYSSPLWFIVSSIILYIPMVVAGHKFIK